LMTKNWKNLQLKIKMFLDQKLQFMHLSLGLHKGRPSYKRSLQLSKENVQHFKTWKFSIFFFCGSFLPSWIQIRLWILQIWNREPQHCQ
jgi:hypothetical protein